jgi:hypothetical protein
MSGTQVRRAGGRQPVGQIIRPRGELEAQAAANAAHRLFFQSQIKRAGGRPSVAQIVTPQGRFGAQAAVQFAHRPLFKVTIQTPGQPQSVAQIVVPFCRFAAQAEANAQHRPLFQPQIKKLGAAGAVARVVMPTGQLEAQAAANARHRPLYQPQIKTKGSPGSVAVVVLRGGMTSQAAAQFAHRPLFQPIIKTLLRYVPPPGSPPVASPVIVRGAFASQAAANFAHRPLFRVLALGLGPAGPPVGHFAAPVGATVADRSGAALYRRFWQTQILRAGGRSPVGRIVKPHGAFSSQVAANFAHRPLFQPQIKTLIQYMQILLPPNPLPVTPRGTFAAQAAANALHRPLFQPQTHTASVSSPTFPNAPLPGVGSPIVPRDPMQDVRMRRHTETVASILNSLLERGNIQLIDGGKQVYSIVGSTFVRNRPPTANDDSTIGASPGMVWIDTVADKPWFNISNAVGAAVWVTSGTETGPSGSFGSSF